MTVAGMKSLIWVLLQELATLTKTSIFLMEQFVEMVAPGSLLQTVGELLEVLA
ncbi:hypothetical protein D9M68_562150 [compost metagenome]